MRPSLNLLAAVSRGQPSKLRKPAMSLDHFIQRQRVLGFWREVTRALHSKIVRFITELASVADWLVQEIPKSSTRDELRSYARQEFERHRNVTDLQHIRYLLSTGKSEFEMMRRYIDEQASH
ncbi:hypothetical protein ANOM_000851 [Aspergillus nomiae NRRL 13137]|uniref:LYR motif-containing protein 2 n=1 Tax=Aspergillus nomiae NRRL (strain ATCC 15546 / NRRL 13137 / CBS 260.88 / M93) TaxID=1509407 RepID=A0A0L1JGG4_ASPN3|nr:uncharacterized protein ANOM_000851 [Aspergillus nomiae NRRL 13137]KNG90802.1 hypothetical protein ANOM_000851 [Aspergillus nomiae NRRL 13137]